MDTWREGDGHLKREGDGHLKREGDGHLERGRWTPGEREMDT